MVKENTVISNKESVQEIYHILKNRDTEGNPLTTMMSRNLRVFAKININLKKQWRKQIQDWRQEQASKWQQIESKKMFLDSMSR